VTSYSYARAIVSQMRRLLFVCGAFLLLWIGAYAAWTIKYPTYSYRFRLGIEVEDDGQAKTASSVLEVKTVQGPCLNPSAPCSRTYVYGPAVVLDLGRKPLLIAALAFGREPLLTSDFEYLPAFAFFGRPEWGKFGADDNIGWTKRLSTMNGTRELTRDLTPLLVWFEDINNPKTVQQVLPEDLPKIFGAKTRFVRAWITLARDPISSGIEQRLAWLKGIGGSYLDGSQLEKSTLSSKLSALNFKGSN
jgi:hypothetical protein